MTLIPNDPTLSEKYNKFLDHIDFFFFGKKRQTNYNLFNCNLAEI